MLLLLRHSDLKPFMHIPQSSIDTAASSVLWIVYSHLPHVTAMTGQVNMVSLSFTQRQLNRTGRATQNTQTTGKAKREE